MTDHNDPSIKTPADRLKYLRKLTRLTRVAIEQDYGLPAATLKAWENGVARLTDKGLGRCLDLYRREGVLCSKEWIMTGDGLHPRYSVDLGRYFTTDHSLTGSGNKESNKEGQASSPTPNAPGTPADPNTLSDDICIVQEAGYFKKRYQDAVILVVAGDEMAPWYEGGDYVAGRLRPQNSLETVVGKDCIVRLKNSNDYVLRRVFRSSDGNGYNLSCLNPVTKLHQPVVYDADIESAAPVIWHRRPNDPS